MLRFLDGYAWSLCISCYELMVISGCWNGSAMIYTSSHRPVLCLLLLLALQSPIHHHFLSTSRASSNAMGMLVAVGRIHDALRFQPVRTTLVSFLPWLAYGTGAYHTLSRWSSWSSKLRRRMTVFSGLCVQDPAEKSIARLDSGQKASLAVRNNFVP